MCYIMCTQHGYQQRPRYMYPPPHMPYMYPPPHMPYMYPPPHMPYQQRPRVAEFHDYLEHAKLIKDAVACNDARMVQLQHDPHLVNQCLQHIATHQKHIRNTLETQHEHDPHLVNHCLRHIATHQKHIRNTLETQHEHDPHLVNQCLQHSPHAPPLY